MAKTIILVGILVMVSGMMVVGCGTFAGEVGLAILEGISGVDTGGSSGGSSRGSASSTRTCPTCDGYGVVWQTEWQGEGRWINCPTCGGKGQI